MSGGNAGDGHPGITPSEVEVHLERMLASSSFQTSQRSQDFLRFVVRRALDGAQDSIKERTIAVEVFGRDPAYDSSEDSFVRVKAGEVRRRLARFYESPSAADKVRIELPVGSYVPHFYRVEGVPVAGAEPEPRRSTRRRWLFAALAILAAAGVGAAWRLHRPSAIELFWRPVLEAPGALLIFLPQPPSYAIVDEKQAQQLHDTPLLLAGPGPLRYAATVPERVGLGAAQGAIRFAAQCVRTGKPYVIKSGADLSFADLRSQPSVVFGAFSSKWTVELNNDFRFRLIRDGADSRIVDAHVPGQQWLPVPGDQIGAPREDYALAGRVMTSKSGQIVLLAAGISTFGTQAAAEFLTDPARLQELAARSPSPLDRGSFQVLLHTRVIGNTPSPPRIVATHFW